MVMVASLAMSRPGQRKREAVAKTRGARSAGHALQKRHVCTAFTYAPDVYVRDVYIKY
jgi:hypothetical protein